MGPKYVEVGPQRAEEALVGCYRRSLELAAGEGCASVAFSAIGTGIYGYPAKDAARVALRTTREFLEGGQGKLLDRIVFVTFEEKDDTAYREAIP